MCVKFEVTHYALWKSDGSEKSGLPASAVEFREWALLCQVSRYLVGVYVTVCLRNMTYFTHRVTRLLFLHIVPGIVICYCRLPMRPTRAI